MRDVRPWSIAARLTIVFAVSVALIQLGASLFLYWSLKHDILEQDRAALVEDLREVRLIMSGDKPAQTAPFRRWVSHVLPREGVYVRILGANGKALSETPGMPVPAAAFPVPVEFSNLPRDPVRWHEPGNGRELMLMAAYAASGNADGSQVIQAALDLDSSEREFIAYRNKLAGVWLGVVLAAIAVGYVGIRRGLSEVRRIALAAGRINAAHFNERLGDHPMPAELKELADAFDAMVRRLRDSFEQLSRFSDDLAHEFRTPLNNLIGAASVTLGRARTAEEYRELVERSMDEYQALSRMIEAMLFLARTENRQIKRQFQQISAASEFEKIIAFFEALADERGVALSQQGDVDLVADPALLRRALSNLVANALRHTVTGQAIVLTAGKTADGQAMLQVADSGEGIAEKHLPHLFDRFYQVDSSRSEGSIGLGLAIVKSIAALHGGSIAVSSRPGMGTAFTLRLPCRPDAG